MKVTKKLRDVKPEELRNYCEGKICPECFLKVVRCCTDSNTCWVYHKDLYSDKFLDQTIEVEVSDILNKEEKEYLSAVIKPFRDKVVEIVKYTNIYFKKDNISIYYKDESGNRSMRFPEFECGTMYKGMALGRPYALEELGL